MSWLSLNSAGQRFWVSTLGVFPCVASVNCAFKLEWVLDPPARERWETKAPGILANGKQKYPQGVYGAPGGLKSQQPTFEGLGSPACIHSFIHSFSTNLV